jgi:hypothetical protein
VSKKKGKQHDWENLPPADKLRALESALRWTSADCTLSFYDTDMFLEECARNGWDWETEEATE